MKNTLNGINSLLDFAKQNITINEYTQTNNPNWNPEKN